MEKEEAITLLAACRLLAGKLSLSGLNVELSPKELKALKGFVRVAEAGLVDNRQIRWEGGLSLKEVTNLARKAQMEFE